MVQGCRARIVVSAKRWRREGVSVIVISIGNSLLRDMYASVWTIDSMCIVQVSSIAIKSFSVYLDGVGVLFETINEATDDRARDALCK